MAPPAILWSFRRCPYAMRARLALASAGISVELREIVLRDKPAEFLSASRTATVPCLQAATDVIDESLDIMHWALGQNDPEGWLTMRNPGHDLIADSDGPFKEALDRYKYSVRYQDTDPLAQRDQAAGFLRTLDERLQNAPWLMGPGPTLADMAILPFIRQFAHVDLIWFTSQPWPDLIRWLEDFKASARFAAVMTKYAPWVAAETPVRFP